MFFKRQGLEGTQKSSLCAGLQPGLCPESVFLLSLTALIFSPFDLLNAVISLLFTFTITHSNLIKFKTLKSCSLPRFTVRCPPPRPVVPWLIESSWTEAMWDQRRGTTAPTSALLVKANLGGFLPLKSDVTFSRFTSNFQFVTCLCRKQKW